MSVCSTCGNEYARAFDVHRDGQYFVFDSMECAAHILAPCCAGCGCRILGHGVEDDANIYCSAHCERVARNRRDDAGPAGDRARGCP